MNKSVQTIKERKGEGKNRKDGKKLYLLKKKQKTNSIVLSQEDY